MILLVDMDEVLTDFVGGCLDMYGRSPKWFEANHQPGVWSIVQTLGVTDSELWRDINALGTRFWLGLRPTPWAYELRGFLHQFPRNSWYVVSSPGHGEAAHSGKRQWLRKFFYSDFRNFIFTSDKWLLAKPGRVLIDDRESSIEVFREHDGHGIVFPSLLNSLYEHRGNPLMYVKGQIHALSFQECQ
jgi:5'(3')-deoxyribonucleotidase